jgi:predicted small integral membrane protein
MFGWMHWTVPSLIGVGGIFAMIIGINILDVRRPGFARKGFLPMETTRGDRVFVSIISSIIVWFLWLKFLPGATMSLSFCIIAPLVFVLMKWG